MNLGYPCINLSLGNKVTTNRSMIKKTFMERGINYAAELCMANVLDLEKILQWNKEHDIRFFRMSPVIFPWASEYGVTNLPNIDELTVVLRRIGNFLTQEGMRMTVHPGPFNVLCSPNDEIVKSTITDLTIQGTIFDLMGLERSPFNKINIHCNGVYGNKLEALDRFCANYERLPDSVRERLTVENDDKASMYSVVDLMYIHEKIGIPIVFDYHHHTFNSGNLTEQQALELAMSTWKQSITPAVHYSSSRRKETNDSKDKSQAHADHVLEFINTYSYDLDIMLECKLKDLALLKYRETHGIKDVVQDIYT